MSNEDVIKVDGVVIAIHRGGIFNVDVRMGEQTSTIVARTSGRMKKYQIKIVVGDAVEVELSPYDLTQGRIVRRSR